MLTIVIFQVFFSSDWKFWMGEDLAGIRYVENIGDTGDKPLYWLFFFELLMNYLHQVLNKKQKNMYLIAYNILEKYHPIYH